MPYRDGAEAVYGLAIRNDGPLSVKVTEIAKPEPAGETVFMFRPVAVRMAGREGLETHYEPGSAEFIDSQPVKFKVLGQTLTNDVELPARVEFRITEATGCPR